MSYIFELYYAPPDDPEREARLAAQVAAAGGQLTFRESATPFTGVCLTFEFDDRAQAEAVHSTLWQQGEHVEGVGDYGP